MATATFSPHLVSLLSYVRSEEAIRAEVIPSPSTTLDASKALMAQIELHIRTGDGYYAKAQYDQAIDEYTSARGLSYKLLFPSFDVTALLRQRMTLLPVSKDLENSFLDASAQIAATLRPQSDESTPLFNSSTAAIPASLQPLAEIGFQKGESVGEVLQRGAQQSALLLIDQNPAAALKLLLPAISQIAAGAQVDPSIAGATQLNAATASIQIGDATSAAKFADQALVSFKSANDVAGQAQALHAKASSLQSQGQAQQASALLDQAASLIAPHTPAVPVVTPSIAAAPVSRLGAAAAPALAPIRIATQPLLQANVEISRQTKDLTPILNKDLSSVTIRLPGAAGGWTTVPAQAALPKDIVADWQIGVPVGTGTTLFNFSVKAQITGKDIAAAIYSPRIKAGISDLAWGIVHPTTTAFYLTHLYAFVLPVKLGDAYHAYGAYSQAEALYLQAAQYSFINPQVEGVSLWIKLGRNGLDWGDSLYRNEDTTNAKMQYNKIISQPSAVPNSSLYVTAGFSVAAASAKTLIDKIDTRPLPGIDPVMSDILLTAHYRQTQIANGVDYYGLTFWPIFTFEYLQSVARGFAQEAISAERDFIDFTTRQEAAEQTRRDLVSAQAMAAAQVDASFQQYQGALDDQTAAQLALTLSTQRRDDAQHQLDSYRNVSGAQIWAQAASQALGGGQDAMFNEISGLANQLDSGQTISGPGPKLAAAQTLSAGRKTQAYEVQKMQDSVNELTTNIAISKAQGDSAAARSAAAEIAWQASQQKSAFANQALSAFDNNFFTPEAWAQMANFMRGLAQTYLFEAVRIAKLMERAYNFENDTKLHVIRNEYGVSVGNPASGQDTRLLGGDSLLSDVESFTFMSVTTKTRKRSRVKDIVSMNADFPAQFDQFRQSGALTVHTDLYEFDRLHPGFYAQRIDAVEVELIGLLPDGGLNGTMTAGGVTSFRRADGTLGTRVHEVDVMALSDFVLRNDTYLYASETGVQGLFQGFGIGSNWKLHLPRQSNDFDYRRIFDVRLTLYYSALYDAGLETLVLNRPLRAGENTRMRSFSLRYDFPDAWYGVYRNGVVQVKMDRFRLPFNQQNFKTIFTVFRISTTDGVSAAGITVKITRPDGTSAQAVSDANGLISTEVAALNSLNGADPLGTWKLEVIDGASLQGADGKLDFSRIFNIQIGLQYSFDYVPES